MNSCIISVKLVLKSSHINLYINLYSTKYRLILNNLQASNTPLTRRSINRDLSANPLIIKEKQGDLVSLFFWIYF